jgi:hypothetical protein
MKQLNLFQGYPLKMVFRTFFSPFEQLILTFNAMRQNCCGQTFPCMHFLSVVKPAEKPPRPGPFVILN